MMKIGKAEEIQIFPIDEDGGDEDEIQMTWEHLKHLSACA